MVGLRPADAPGHGRRLAGRFALPRPPCRTGGDGCPGGRLCSIWSTQLLSQTYSPGATLLDPLWVVGLVAIGVGGVLAARAPEKVAELDEPAQRGGLLPALMFALLLGALVRASLQNAPDPALFILGAGMLLSGGALVIRGSLLERRLREMLEWERATLASLADREEELARKNEQLLEDSRRDPLTGMRNRRALADDLPKLEAIHRERGDGFALALCDVDHFKAYNDRLGHLAGDQVLRAIAATVRGALRAGDIAYRFGGEELLLILRGTDIDAARTAAERVRQAVEKMAIPHPGGVGGTLTVSIGLAAGKKDAAALLARADAALYQAKREGRNRADADGGRGPLPDGGRTRTVTEEPVPRHLRSMLPSPGRLRPATGSSRSSMRWPRRSAQSCPSRSSPYVCSTAGRSS